jgi:hypothetical protein
MSNVALFTLEVIDSYGVTYFSVCLKHFKQYSPVAHCSGVPCLLKNETMEVAEADLISVCDLCRNDRLGSLRV